MSKYKIVFLDDNAEQDSLIAGIELVLKNLDYSFEQVQSIDEFTDKFATKDFDLIIVDYNLNDKGGLDGIDFIRTLKEVNYEGDIVLYSGEEDFASRASVESLPGVYIVKKGNRKFISFIKELILKSKEQGNRS